MISVHKSRAAGVASLMKQWLSDLSKLLAIDEVCSISLKRTLSSKWLVVFWLLYLMDLGNLSNRFALFNLFLKSSACRLVVQ